MSGTAVIVGASGGIGSAIAEGLEKQGGYDRVVRLARSSKGDLHIDVEIESTIEAAAARIKDGPAPTLVFVASGILHEAGRGPEKAMRDLDSAWLVRNYQLNAIGPALVAKHFLPLMPRRKRCVFAALSARVGSISDNRLGGWYGYRASKAALNMLIRNLAIEFARKNDRAIVTALHPGTVDTRLSAPFQTNVPERQLFSPDRAAAALIDTIGRLKPADSGRIFAWDGTEITP